MCIAKKTKKGIMLLYESGKGANEYEKISFT